MLNAAYLLEMFDIALSCTQARTCVSWNHDTASTSFRFYTDTGPCNTADMREGVRLVLYTPLHL